MRVKTSVVPSSMPIADACSSALCDDSLSNDVDREDNFDDDGTTIAGARRTGGHAIADDDDDVTIVLRVCDDNDDNASVLAS